ncbi:MAG TPA: hypothetical protein VF035_06595 [Longimicrobiales bacterium]
MKIEQHGSMGYSQPPKAKGVYWAFMLLGSPTVFLAMLTARYALRDPACESTGVRVLMEIAGALTVLVPLLIVIAAWRHWRADRIEWPNDAPDTASRDRFLAVTSLTIALFGIAAALALWMPSLFLSACDTQ